MRLRTSTAAALVLTAGLAMGGCTSKGSVTATTQAPTQTPTAATNAASNTQTGQAGDASSSTPSAQSGQVAGSGTACQAANLSFALGTASGTGTGQHTQPVDLTNRGSSACTMDGFPGVDLVGVADGQQDYTWPLERSSAQYTRVTLPPGGVAHFDLLYLPSTPSASRVITVLKLVLTPPNTFTQAEVTWNQSVLLQDAATHPGTYITPIAPGS